MHQTQYARVAATTLDEALGALNEHLRAHGGANCGFRWTVALLPSGEVLVADAPDRDELTSAELADHERHRQRALTFFAARDTWQRHPWREVLANLELGVPKMFGTSEDFTTTDDELTRLSPAGLAPWFFARAHAALREAYETARFDEVGLFAKMASGRRHALAEVLETTYREHLDAEEPTLPYRAGQHPADWPAHLVGPAAPAERTVYLAFDMRF